MTDPRSANCKEFKVNDAGKVVGVNLEYREMPETKYQLTLVQLIDEVNASGNTVANYLVHNIKGFPVSEPVRLAWPWPNLVSSTLPGNPNNQHMIVNGYNPPDIGPLAMYVADDKGNPISDVIGGLGLPFNRHVCYNMIWVERGFDDDTGGNGDAFQTEMLLTSKELLLAVLKLNEHLGVK